MKALIRKLMPVVSCAAFAMAIGTIGTTCRSILYQPKTPQRLLDMDA